MKMTSMLLDKEEKKELTTNKVAESKPRFPYGLRISLEKTALEKLGMKCEDYSKGDEIFLTAKGEVVGVSSRKDEWGESETVDIQLTHVGLEEGEFEKAFDKAIKSK